MIKRIWKEHKALRIIAVIILIIVIIVSGLFISVNMILSRANKARNTFAIAGQEYIEKKKMTNILLLGCDKREDLINHSGIAGQNGQTDFICLASIDWENETVYLTSIPRETVTDIHVRDNDGNVTQVESKQLCLEYAYGRSPDEGSQYMVDAVSQILGGTSIDYYCTISMGAIIGLLDDVGGVTVNVSNDCETTLWEYKAGDLFILEVYIQTILTWIEWADRRILWLRLFRSLSQLLNLIISCHGNGLINIIHIMLQIFLSICILLSHMQLSNTIMVLIL